MYRVKTRSLRSTRRIYCLFRSRYGFKFPQSAPFLHRSRLVLPSTTRRRSSRAQSVSFGQAYRTLSSEAFHHMDIYCTVPYLEFSTRETMYRPFVRPYARGFHGATGSACIVPLSLMFRPFVVFETLPDDDHHDKSHACTALVQTVPTTTMPPFCLLRSAHAKY